MDKLNNLCILKRDEPLVIGHSQFDGKKHYRVSFDENGKGCIVYGEWMSMKKFKEKFELYIPVLQTRLYMLGMVVRRGISNDYQPVSFKEFKDRVGINNYGRGVSKMKIITLGEPKENLFAFYPEISPNPIALKQCYEMYVKLVNGEWEDVDSGDIVWGNGGIPLVYGKIRVR